MTDSSQYKALPVEGFVFDMHRIVQKESYAATLPQLNQNKMILPCHSKTAQIVSIISICVLSLPKQLIEVSMRHRKAFFEAHLDNLLQIFRAGERYIHLNERSLAI